MSNIQIKLDSAGIMQLLSSGEVQSFVDSIANERAGSLSGNYEIQTTVKSGRAVSNIKTADKDTYYRNLKTNELLKATSPNKPSR